LIPQIYNTATEFHGKAKNFQENIASVLFCVFSGRFWAAGAIILSVAGYWALYLKPHAA
jgi:hypothetical protein